MGERKQSCGTTCLSFTVPHGEVIINKIISQEFLLKFLVFIILFEEIYLENQPTNNIIRVSQSSIQMISDYNIT